jgi:tRNA nucleotidyltransferase/poly(A) polymerase
VRLTPPQEVRSICATLERAGHEAWCVGGAVRDALLGIETLDWDIATSARPEQVQKLFKRTVPVGIQFGTVGVLDREGVLHEVTTFRHDVETDGRHAVVKFGASLDEDLARRDFTINAIAVHAERLEVRDPFGGREDLEKRVLRCVGEASQRMREDRLRALRALRFAGRFDFAIEPQTWNAIVESAPELGRLSMERVKQELEKVMEQVARPSSTMERYREAGILRTLVPVLADVPRERFAALDFLGKPGPAGRPQRRLLRLAALFAEPGIAPARSLEQTLKTLKFSNADARTIAGLAAAVGSIELSEVQSLASAPTQAANAVRLRRLIARAGRLAVPSLARLLWARTTAEATHRIEAPAARALYRQALRSAFNDPLSINDLALDGEDLQQLGVPLGPQLGKTLAALLEAVLVNPEHNDRATLQALVKELAAREPTRP